MGLFQRIWADASFYFRLTHPQTPPSAWAVCMNALHSRGWWLLLFQRIGYYGETHRNLKNPGWWLARLIDYIGRYLINVIGKSDFRYDSEFNGDVYLSNQVYLTLGPQKVGSGVIIHDHVTCGFAVVDKRARPVIGDNVWIGPECIIVGGLKVGEGATLMPGTIITNDVPPHCVMSGNPSRIIRQNFDNTALRQSLTIITSLPGVSK